MKHIAWTMLKNSSWTFLRQAGVLPFRGETKENEHLRFHVWNSSVKVWDLENAGKRGKTVPVMVVWDADFVQDPQLLGALIDWVKDLPKSTFAQAVARVKALDAMPVEGFGRTKLEFRNERGVDVAPAGFGPIIINTPNVHIEADWNTFSVRDHIDRNNEPTCIPSSKGGKDSIKVFFIYIYAGYIFSCFC